MKDTRLIHSMVIIVIFLISFSRFFAHGLDGTSGSRFKEQVDREAFMERLHVVETRINDSIKNVWIADKQILTFEGVDYAQKMKTDYINILRKLKKERDDEEGRPNTQ